MPLPKRMKNIHGVNIFSRESINKYLQSAPNMEQNATRLALGKSVPPAVVWAGYKAHQDVKAVDAGTATPNEFKRGITNSAITGATLLPLIAAGIYAAGRGKAALPLAPSMKKYITGLAITSAAGGALGAGAYAFGRGAEHGLKKIDELNDDTTL
jgi:hypothetical protein